MRAVITLIIFLMAVLLDSTVSAAEDSRICAPFRGGVVDPAIVKIMLTAADEGRLYRIHSSESQVGFCVDSKIGRVQAEFKGVQGGFALRRETWGDASQMLVMVDTDTLAMDETFLKNMLKSEHFLDTYSYPKILFVSTGLTWLDQNNAILQGDLTMHGVTRPIRFDVNVSFAESEEKEGEDGSAKGDRLVVTAKSFLYRSDFNMKNLSFLVSNTVELCMRVDAVLYKHH